MQELEQAVLIDTTLRDGEQAPGLAFSAQDKLAMAKALDKAGVTWIEAGIPIMGYEEQKALQQILQAGLKAIVFSWNRACHEDIRASLECGFEFLHISVPVSDLHIERKLGKNRDWVFGQLKSAILLAQSHGCTFSVGAEDASRAHPKQFLELAEFAAKRGAVRIRYADTVGILDPFSTREIVRELVASCALPIEFHAHNDFGLATANTLVALSSGAACASVTVGGIGERAGNAALEEVLAALEGVYQARCGIDLAAAKKLCCKLESITRRKITSSKMLDTLTGRSAKRLGAFGGLM